MGRLTNRSRAVIAYHEANSDATLVEIGELFRKNDGEPLTKQRVHTILNYRACRTCYHSRAFGALCACREKADMIKHDCPDWHSAERG